jgi:hypothetical protein
MYWLKNIILIYGCYELLLRVVYNIHVIIIVILLEVDIILDRNDIILNRKLRLSS